MSKTKVLVPALLIGLLAFVPGCTLERDKKANRNRTQLVGGATIPESMEGWVAVPRTTPKEVSGKVNYAVLSGHNIVPDNMNGWLAMSPNIFEKRSGIKAEAGNPASGEMFVMKGWKKVPRDKEGWIGLPFMQPRMQGTAEEGVAELGADQIIPKEMTGWVAMDKEAVAKMATETISRDVTIPAKK